MSYLWHLLTIVVGLLNLATYFYSPQPSYLGLVLGGFCLYMGINGVIKQR